MATRRNHSVGLRIWHWLDALVVIGLITTYFLRQGLVSSLRFFTRRLSEGGLSVADATTRPITRELVHQLWAWHVYFGYALTTLLVLRVILFFTDKRNPVRDCWEGICRLRTHYDFRNIHNVGVRAGYVAFYALQLFMVVSGLMLTFDQSLGLGKDFRHLVNEAHETVMWFFLAFVIAHIVGVFAAENRDDPGIVSAMINGKG
jgi:Ni,Fe-hydrogenase I cytochrome b subunit